MGLAEKVGQTLEEHAEEWGYSGVMGNPLEILSMGSTRHNLCSRKIILIAL